MARGFWDEIGIFPKLFGIPLYFFLSISLAIFHLTYKKKGIMQNRNHARHIFKVIPFSYIQLFRLQIVSFFIHPYNRILGLKKLEFSIFQFFYFRGFSRSSFLLLFCVSVPRRNKIITLALSVHMYCQRSQYSKHVGNSSRTHGSL